MRRKFDAQIRARQNQTRRRAVNLCAGLLVCLSAPLLPAKATDVRGDGGPRSVGGTRGLAAGAGAPARTLATYPSADRQRRTLKPPARHRSAPRHRFAQTGGRAPAAPAQDRDLPIDVVAPRIVPVGKWPEGLGWDGTHLWVAESGQRRLARIDPGTGKIVRRVKVGRLPVGIASTADGTIYSVVATDNRIWRQTPDGNGRTFGRVKDYPEAITSDADAVYVLGWVNDRSSRARVTRFDRGSGARTFSAIIASNHSTDIVASAGSVWIVHRPSAFADGTEIVRLDRKSLEVQHRVAVSGKMRKLAASSDGVIVAGGVGARGIVQRIDGVAGTVVATRRLQHGGAVANLARSGDHVISVSHSGTIHIMRASDLAVLRIVQLGDRFSDSGPQSTLVFGNRLAITSHRGSGRNGTVLIVPDWQP